MFEMWLRPPRLVATVFYSTSSNLPIFCFAFLRLHFSQAQKDLQQLSGHYVGFFFKDLIHFFLERGEGGRKRGKETSICERSIAQPGNQTNSLSVGRPMLSPLSHTSQGSAPLTAHPGGSPSKPPTDHNQSLRAGSRWPCLGPGPESGPGWQGAVPQRPIRDPGYCHHPERKDATQKSAQWLSLAALFPKYLGIHFSERRELKAQSLMGKKEENNSPLSKENGKGGHVLNLRKKFKFHHNNTWTCVSGYYC